MGVIPINFSPEVEVHIKGMKRGNRSQWVNRVVRDAIQSKLSDTESQRVCDLSIPLLIQKGVSRVISRKWVNTPEEARLYELRNLLLEHIEKMVPNDL